MSSYEDKSGARGELSLHSISIFCSWNSPCEARWFVGRRLSAAVHGMGALGLCPMPSLAVSTNSSLASCGRNIHFEVKFTYFCCLYIGRSILNTAHWSVLWGCTLYKSSFPIPMAGYFSLLLPDIITPGSFFMWLCDSCLLLAVGLHALWNEYYEQRLLIKYPIIPFDYFQKDWFLL